MEENNLRNQTPINTPIQNMVKSAQKDSTAGPMIGSIIIIIIILIGGLYFLSSLISTKKNQIKAEQNLKQQTETLEVEQAAKQSESDEIPSIEADLKSTNIDVLDSRLSEIEKEF